MLQYNLGSIQCGYKLVVHKEQFIIFNYTTNQECIHIIVKHTKSIYFANGCPSQFCKVLSVNQFLPYVIVYVQIGQTKCSLICNFIQEYNSEYLLWSVNLIINKTPLMKSKTKDSGACVWGRGHEKITFAVSSEWVFNTIRKLRILYQ